MYYLGMGSVLYGVDADLIDHKILPPSRQEHIRRLTEVAHIMLDAGMIFIISARELTADDYDVICTGIPPEKITVIWVGEEKTTDIPVKMHINNINDIEECVRMVRKHIRL